MRFFDYIKLAYKNLTRRKLRTFLTTIAVVVGAIAVTTLVSLGQNAGKSFADMINNLGILNMVTVSPDPDSEGGGGMIGTGGGDSFGGKKINDTSVADVKKIGHVKDATPVAALWFESMQLKGESKKVRSNIIAFDPESKAFPIQTVAGRTIRKDDMGKIVLGAGNLKAFGYADRPNEIVGKKLLLNTKGNYTGWGTEAPSKPPQNQDENWWKEQEKKTVQVEVEIVGVAGSTGDDWQDFTNLAWAHAVQTRREWQEDKTKREALEQAQRNGQNVNWTQTMVLQSTDEILQNGYNSLIVQIDDSKNADTVVAAVKKLGYGATTAKEMIDTILNVIKLITQALGAIGGIALVVAAIGIINTMAMAIFERTKEIGVMRACGATRATVRRLFTLEAALIGLIGGVVGVGVSYGAALIGNWAMEQYGAASSIPITDFVYFPYWLCFGVIGFTTLIGLFAGLYPAFKAARLSPVEALRQNK